MTQLSDRWLIRLLATSLIGAALICSPAGSAAEAEPIQVATLSPADSDLLLFWEEKELYVQTATRSEKPLTQVAENMTVITAREIEAMNANSVAEVLARVPGLFVNFGTNDYVSAAQISIQGSEPRHVTVLLDGMPVNFLSDGHAETSFIPLRIVVRIEIVKGAASSAWGSALGGVVNIITRATGDKPLPNGMLSGSYGEGNSRDLTAELRGKNGPLGYYLFAGQQASDGLRNNRDFRRTSVFAKLLLTPTRDLDITLIGGFSNPELNEGEVSSLFVSSKSLLRNRFLNSVIEYRATPELTVRGGLNLFNSYTDQPVQFLATFPTFPGQLSIQNIFDEQTVSAHMRATWNSGIQTLTVGGEASHGTLDQTTNAGQRIQDAGLPASVTINSRIDKWGLFANDTVAFGSLAITPGIRLDHDSFTGYFVSPSLGLTWELGEHSVARASAARGFTSPPLSFLAGGGPFFSANNQLQAEYGWSYQAGIESGLADLVNLKGTLFRHETTKAITTVNTAPSTAINQGDVTRQGYELEADSVPYYNLSLKLGHAYMHSKADTVSSGHTGNSFDNYSWLVGIKYDDRRSFTALLSGSYVYWDLDSSQGVNSDKYTTFIWDLTATKKFRSRDTTNLETFLTIHNLFSGAHHTVSVYPNPPRWVEAGLRFKF